MPSPIRGPLIRNLELEFTNLLVDLKQGVVHFGDLSLSGRTFFCESAGLVGHGFSSSVSQAQIAKTMREAREKPLGVLKTAERHDSRIWRFGCLRSEQPKPNRPDVNVWIDMAHVDWPQALGACRCGKQATCWSTIVLLDVKIHRIQEPVNIHV